MGQDTFQRGNQAGWGTASDGQKWGSDATNTGVFSINGNAGQIANGNTAYNAVLGASAGDSEVVLSGTISSFNNANLGVALRWKATNNWYKAYINGTNLVLQSKVNGTATTLKSIAFTANGQHVVHHPLPGCRYDTHRQRLENGFQRAERLGGERNQ